MIRAITLLIAGALASLFALLQAALWWVWARGGELEFRGGQAIEVTRAFHPALVTLAAVATAAVLLTLGVRRIRRS